MPVNIQSDWFGRYWIYFHIWGRPESDPTISDFIHLLSCIHALLQIRSVPLWRKNQDWVLLHGRIHSHSQHHYELAYFLKAIHLMPAGFFFFFKWQLTLKSHPLALGRLAFLITGGHWDIAEGASVLLINLYLNERHASLPSALPVSPWAAETVDSVEVSPFESERHQHQTLCLSSCEKNKTKTWSVLSAKPNIYLVTCELFRCLCAILFTKGIPQQENAGLPCHILWQSRSGFMGTDGACHVDYSKSFNPNIFGFNFPTFRNGAFFPHGPRHHLFNPFTPVCLIWWWTSGENKSHRSNLHLHLPDNKELGSANSVVHYQSTLLRWCKVSR